MIYKCKAVILPTKDKTEIVSHQNILYYDTNLDSPKGGKNYHLYILSDEEIKVGDWVYSLEYEDKYKVELSKIDHTLNRKIIATTDTSLNLPKLSNNFIKQYCEENGISKVTPDDIIIIKEVKDSWNREEVLNLLKELYETTIEGQIGRDGNDFDTEAFNNWIEENL